MNKISFFTLGGQDEQNRFTGVLEINNFLYLFCAGAGDIYRQVGAQKSLPDLEYIEQNKHRIKGILIGTPKYNLIGALCHIIAIIPNVPIYTTEIGKLLILGLWSNSKTKSNLKQNIYLKIEIVTALKEIKIDSNLILLPFHVVTEIPNSLGWIVKYNEKNIVLIDEFIVFNDLHPGYENHLHLLPQLTNNDVFLLVVGTQSVGNNSGFAWPNCCNANWLKKCFSQSQSNIIVACYRDNLWFIIKLLELAKLYKLAISIFSSNLWNLIMYLSQINCFDIKKIVWIKDLKKAPVDNTLILISEHFDELYDKCHTWIHDPNDGLNLKSDNSFILATKTFPGIESNEAELLNEVNRYCTTFHQDKKINNFQAGKEDIKYLVNILKPHNLIPVCGYYKEIINLSAALDNFYDQKKIHILYNGEKITFKDNAFFEISNINVNVNFVDFEGNIETKPTIMVEKAQMNHSGVVVVSLLYNAEELYFIDPEINFWGVFVEDFPKKDEIIKLSYKVVSNEIKKSLVFNNSLNIKELKNQIKKVLTWTFERSAQKKPAILTLISHYKKSK